MTGFQSKRQAAIDKNHFPDVGNMVVQKPLTEERIEEIFESAAGADEETVLRFARAIEAAHGIKVNT